MGYSQCKSFGEFTHSLPWQRALHVTEGSQCSAPAWKHSVRALINHPRGFGRDTQQQTQQQAGSRFDAAARYNDNTTLSSPAKYCLFSISKGRDFSFAGLWSCFCLKLPTLQDDAYLLGETAAACSCWKCLVLRSASSP